MFVLQHGNATIYWLIHPVARVPQQLIGHNVRYSDDAVPLTNRVHDMGFTAICWMMMIFPSCLAVRLAAAGLILGLSATAVATPADPSSGEDARFAAIRAADLRLGTIGFRIATANAALCDRLEPGAGWILHTIDQYGGSSRDAARLYFGFAGPVAVQAVVSESPAERAGVRANDALSEVGSFAIDQTPPAGAPNTRRLVATHGAIAGLPGDRPLAVAVQRGQVPTRVTVMPLPACRTRFEVEIAPNYVARADGEMVQIGVRNLEEYGDDDIAVTVAHELAHNILRHRDRLAAKGVEFGVLAGFGANVKYFRQTEIEADILSVAMLANAGYDPAIAVDFWRRVGPARASGWLRSRSHPDWRDRMATIEGEVKRLSQIGPRPVVPQMLEVRNRALDGDWQRLIVRARK